MTAIAYPITHPTTPAFVSCGFIARSVVAQSISPFSLVTQEQEHDGQALEMAMQLPPMKRAQAEEWVAFLLRLHGKRGTFYMTPPGGGTPRGSILGTPMVSGPSQTGDVLVVDGWTPSATGVLLAGDWIQLGTGATSRVHKVLENADASAGGVTSLRLWPSLRESPGNNSAVVVTNPVGVFKLLSNDAQWDVGLAQVYGISLAAREDL